MKKIININLSGRVIPIEDSAYESLQKYIESLRRYFAQEEGRDEIINDIESRVAELMSDKIKKGASAITDADIQEIIASMGRIEDFEEVETETKNTTGSAQASAATAQAIPKNGKGRLYRDANDKLLGGVCSGIASYMNFDPAIVRLLFAIISFGGFGLGFLIYILLWIILPVRNLDVYQGKRLFRNPEDKVISGVAGGLAAYFDKPSWVVRLIFVAPILLNMVFGTLHGLYFNWNHDIFPNLFIGSFSGIFIVSYIILWIVLPEAKSAFEKMEMRGEKVDVNRIRQNVKDEMESFKTRTQAWGQEVKTSAQDLGARAKDFANTRGKAFAGEMAEVSRPIGRGLGHIIGVLFKSFFIFIAGCIALSLFAVLLVVIFGGVAWWPINNYLWTSAGQKLLAWGTVILFITVPVIAFMTWLIRRVVRVRTRNPYLGYTFGSLWLIGLVCVILFSISIAKDLRVYEKVQSDLPVQVSSGRLVVKVNEPEIRNSENLWWIHNDDNSGWSINEDTMRYSHVKVRIQKSDDSAYHVHQYKFSAGSSAADAQNRAEQIVFNTSLQDSILNIGSGLAISRNSKFRGQGVIIDILVPVGKKIRFDESLMDAYNNNVVRYFSRDYNRGWNRRNRFEGDWDYDEYFDWKYNMDYVMTSDSRLVEADHIIHNKNGVFEKKPSADSLQKEIEQREKKNEEDRRKLEELKNQKDIESTTIIKKHTKYLVEVVHPFLPLII